MNSFSIEPGTSDDLDAIMAVMRDAFDPRFGEAWTAAQLIGVLAMPGCHVAIARSHSTIGFALARTILDETELMLIAVDPAQRRQGTGRALIDAIRDQAARIGSKSIFLEVRDGNPATALYVQSGFSPCGRRSNYYRGANGEIFDAVTYRSLT
jgi:[ribosomal protein S18]-alanine N-acetyltransferase